VILAGAMNTQVVVSTAGEIPYIAIGAAAVALVAIVFVKIKSSAPLPTDDKKEPVIV